MATTDHAQQAFETAKSTFKKRLKDDKLFEDLLKSTSIKNVWDAIDKVQTTQDAERRIRRIRKMENFLSKLSSYATVIDTFVQLKPDVMALVWGPIRILLLCTENVAKLTDAVVNAMEQIGDALPNFIEVIEMFGKNDKLIHKLALFYEDILEFYIVAFEFFNASSEDIFFSLNLLASRSTDNFQRRSYSSNRCGPSSKPRLLC